MLGEFEYLLLAASVRLGNEAYGVTIRLEIENATGHSCSVGALYTTLDRLESKGLIRTWAGEVTPSRGGRPKRMVEATASGMKAADAFYETVLKAGRGISWHKEGVQS
jgi:PadR family transcriptional regulator, regulatory protein PadR